MRLLAMGGAEARGGAVYRALRPFDRWAPAPCTVGPCTLQCTLHAARRPGSSQAADSGSSSDSDDQARVRRSRKSLLVMLHLE